MAERKTRKPKDVVAPEVETTIAVVPPVKKELVLEGDPEQQLAFAAKAANALMTVVSKKPRKVMIQGKQYLEFGDWQILGRFYGATPSTEWTREILKDGKNYGYEARCTTIQKGEVISSAEGMCTRGEKRWQYADEYAIRSMAQTRTGAKALRNAFGWVAELAGYASTPAEEMDGISGYEHPQEQTRTPAPTQPLALDNPVVADYKKKMENAKTLSELGTIWANVPPQAKKTLAATKDEMKAILETEILADYENN